MAFDLDGSARQHGGHSGVLADGGSAAVPARPLAGAQAAEAEQGRSIRLRRKVPHTANYNSASRQGITRFIANPLCCYYRCVRRRRIVIDCDQTRLP